ncbi:MAG: site-specific integrase [Verrucomicrobiae bacterium]|nr:site-specific integrase [Verrucomicrobiae bacterium]
MKAAETLPVKSAALCLLLCYTGCRISEALALAEADIDWSTDVIRFRCLKKRGKEHVRRVPISGALKRKLKLITPSSGRIWSISRATGWRIIKSAMNEAGIVGIHASPKGLRHGFGVRCAMVGVPLNILQEWMGHSDPATTAIYLDIRDEEERELIKRTWKF